jgi:hypothetical protein
VASEPIVSCADDLGTIYPRLKLRHYAGIITGFLLFQLFASWTGWDWLSVVPFIVFFAVMLPWAIRFGREYQRRINSLVCPHCGQPAGKTFTKQGILHLRCQHCGKETRTDALVFYKGPPIKV